MNFPLLALFLVGLVIAVTYSIPLERGRLLIVTALDRIHAWIERTNHRPLYLLPVCIFEWMIAFLAIAVLFPFILVFIIQSRT